MPTFHNKMSLNSKTDYIVEFLTYFCTTNSFNKFLSYKFKALLIETQKYVQIIQAFLVNQITF